MRHPVGGPGERAQYAENQTQAITLAQMRELAQAFVEEEQKTDHQRHPAYALHAAKRLAQQPDPAQHQEQRSGLGDDLGGRGAHGDHRAVVAHEVGPQQQPGGEKEQAMARRCGQASRTSGEFGRRQAQPQPQRGRAESQPDDGERVERGGHLFEGNGQGAPEKRGAKRQKKTPDCRRHAHPEFIAIDAEAARGSAWPFPNQSCCGRDIRREPFPLVTPPQNSKGRPRLQVRIRRSGVGALARKAPCG